MFEFTHLVYDEEHDKVKKYYEESWIIIKFILFFMLTVDSIYLYLNFPNDSLRLARIFRPGINFLKSFAIILQQRNVHIYYFINKKLEINNATLFNYVYFMFLICIFNSLNNII